MIDKTCVIYKCNIVMSVTGTSLTAFGVIHVFVHILVKTADTLYITGNILMGLLSKIGEYLLKEYKFFM